MSERNDILGSITTTLKNITKANGYKTAPSKVVRGFLPIEKIMTFPALMVFGGNETFEGMLDGVTVRSAFTIKVRGVTLDKADPETAVCNAIADVLKCLESGDNSLREEMVIHAVDTDEGWFQMEREGSGFFEVSLDIFYTFDRSNP